jgi:hypothetical protein
MNNELEEKILTSVCANFAHTNTKLAVNLPGGGMKEK